MENILTQKQSIPETTVTLVLQLVCYRALHLFGLRESGTEATLLASVAKGRLDPGYAHCYFSAITTMLCWLSVA